MGSCDEKKAEYESYKEPQKILQICLASLGSFLVSMTGGLVLAWWISHYHHSNTQLWMVPFGLVMFTTPILLCFAMFFSDICNLNSNQQAPSMDHSISNPER